MTSVSKRNSCWEGKPQTRGMSQYTGDLIGHIWLANHPLVCTWTKRWREMRRGAASSPNWKNKGQNLRAWSNKIRLSHYSAHQHTYNHHHRGDTQCSTILDYSYFDTTFSGERWCSTMLHVSVKIPQFSAELFISFSLLTSFSVMLGQMRMSLLRFGKAK